MGPGAWFKTLEQGQEGAVVGESLDEDRRVAAAAGTARGLGMNSRKWREVGRACNYSASAETGAL